MSCGCVDNGSCEGCFRDADDDVSPNIILDVNMAVLLQLT
jgi:hypothetical protein